MNDLFDLLSARGTFRNEKNTIVNECKSSLQLSLNLC